MTTRIFATLLAIVLVLCYVAPMVLKLKDFALVIVIGVGAIAMVVDLAHSLRDAND
ncbi:hypothetical protein [Hydrogenophaga sp.]|uniref:hypothetical protein n=1 Tax=Hydrogenophaga sp. TaxID=1904254 RepID=UPI00272F1BA8|nr:hypothetical protein [Hydrogenophaga sp.]MDP1687801.1 hypothetical protein [Hydrogenophaga sp.]MDP3085218.1 hypothetical protein [Rubrivivax sp.]